MPTITFVQPDGARRSVEIATGLSVMEAAVRNAIPGIDADCGGACACATCHIHIADDWIGVVGAPEAMEESMLEFAEDVGPTSRLGCQIKVTDQLDGLVVAIP
ncbi:2Fe-2S iron-sulfur cluster-binding protein [soil metagenome]